MFNWLFGGSNPGQSIDELARQIGELVSVLTGQSWVMLFAFCFMVIVLVVVAIMIMSHNRRFNETQRRNNEQFKETLSLLIENHLVHTKRDIEHTAAETQRKLTEVERKVDENNNQRES